MRKFIIVTGAALVAAAGVVAPAQADKPAKSKTEHQATTKSPKRDRCDPRRVGYNASGKLVSSALTKGEDGRYSGTIVVDVKRANHRAPKGTQTFTLENARVRFGKDVDPAAPAPGSRVKLHGKTTKLHKGCPTEGFTATTTIRNVSIKKAKEQKAEQEKPKTEQQH
jgi:hypothetical protein